MQLFRVRFQHVKSMNHRDYLVLATSEDGAIARICSHLGLKEEERSYLRVFEVLGKLADKVFALPVL
jgi:ethanolamine transporter EutH